MTEFERFAQALALTESDDSELSWGDPKQPEATSRAIVVGHDYRVRGAQFMALGRWQMHPAWFLEWYDPAISVSWSWDEAFRAALQKFWTAMQKLKLQPHHAAMAFHLGMSAYQRGDWDQTYAERFQRFWGQLA
jgi:hypothetical protein